VKKHDTSRELTKITEKQLNFCLHQWPYYFFFFLQAPPQWAVGGADWTGAGEQVPLPGNLW
jgi:hypothetical protein